MSDVAVMEKGQTVLAELLLHHGIINADQLAIAIAEHRQNGTPLTRALTALGFVSESALRDVNARNAGRQTIDLGSIIADPEALRLIPQEFARRHRVIPVAYDQSNQCLTVAVTEMFNGMVLDRLRAMLGGIASVKVQLAGTAEVEDRIERFYGREQSIDGILGELEAGDADHARLDASADESAHPMVRLLNALIVDAAKRGASDIHLEPEYGCVRIRYRIDGVLETARAVHRKHLPGMTVRVKVLSEMNIAETRAPQDGRFTLTVGGRPIDFRVSTQPTMHGENIVLRVLDREKSIIRLEDMRLSPATLERLSSVLARPEGLLIVTGPTGSGKTTTLYSLLARVNDETVNIMTLEDPVEYHLGLLRQTSVNESARIDFANGVRAILRQDPDIILIGEIRDRETAEMAFRAAMTGHQVYTTLHTNSALGAFPRLLDIGIRPGLFAGNILGVIAQRLVRVLCPSCKIASPPTDAERALLETHGISLDRVYHPAGCPACRQKGYQGRAPIMEVLVMNEELDDLVARGATAREMRACALANGFRSLTQDGLQQVADGITSLQELTRTVVLSPATRFETN